MEIINKSRRDLNEKKYKQLQIAHIEKCNELSILSTKYANIQGELKRSIASHSTLKNDFCCLKARCQSLENDRNTQQNFYNKKYQYACQEIDNVTTTCYILRSELEQLEKKEKESAETINELKLRLTMATEIQTDVDDRNELLAVPKYTIPDSESRNFEQVSIKLETIDDPFLVSTICYEAEQEIGLENEETESWQNMDMGIEEEDADIFNIRENLSETRNQPALIHMITHDWYLDTNETLEMDEPVTETAIMVENTKSTTLETDSMKTQPLNYFGNYVKISEPSQSGAFRIQPYIGNLAEDNDSSQKIKSVNKNTKMRKRNTFKKARKIAHTAVNSKKNRDKFVGADNSATVLSPSHLMSCAHGTNISASCHSTRNHIGYHTCHDPFCPLQRCSNMYGGCNNCCLVPANNYGRNQLQLRMNGHEDDEQVGNLTQTTQSRLRDLHVDRKKKNRQIMKRKMKLRRRQIGK